MKAALDFDEAADEVEKKKQLAAAFTLIVTFDPTRHMRRLCARPRKHIARGQREEDCQEYGPVAHKA